MNTFFRFKKSEVDAMLFAYAKSKTGLSDGAILVVSNVPDFVELIVNPPAECKANDQL